MCLYMSMCVGGIATYSILWFPTAQNNVFVELNQLCRAQKFEVTNW